METEPTQTIEPINKTNETEAEINDYIKEELIGKLAGMSLVSILRSIKEVENARGDNNIGDIVPERKVCRYIKELRSVETIEDLDKFGYSDDEHIIFLENYRPEHQYEESRAS